MSLTVVQRPLSGMTAGVPISVTSTGLAGTGTLIHTGPTSTADHDIIYAWVNNTSSLTRTVFVDFAGVIMTDEVGARSGFYPVITGIHLQGVSGGTANTIRMYLSASALNLHVIGHTDRVTEA